MYKVFPSSHFPGSVDIPEYIRCVSSDKIATDKVYKIELPKVCSTNIYIYIICILSPFYVDDVLILFYILYMIMYK